MGIVAYWQSDYWRALTLCEVSLLRSRGIGTSDVMVAGLEDRAGREQALQVPTRESQEE